MSSPRPEGTERVKKIPPVDKLLKNKPEGKKCSINGCNNPVGASNYFLCDQHASSSYHPEQDSVGRTPRGARVAAI